MPKYLRYLILALLVLLPACFPYASRCGYLTPLVFGDAGAQTEQLVLWSVGFFLAMALYWCVVGHLFARWVGALGKSFFLGNLPVFFNAIGEIIFYAALAKEPADFPLIAYLIGSHIDKIHLFGVEKVLPSILLDAFILVILFVCGYEIKKRKLNDVLTSKSE